MGRQGRGKCSPFPQWHPPKKPLRKRLLGRGLAFSKTFSFEAKTNLQFQGQVGDRQAVGSGGGEEILARIPTQFQSRSLPPPTPSRAYWHPEARERKGIKQREKGRGDKSRILSLYDRNLTLSSPFSRRPLRQIAPINTSGRKRREKAFISPKEHVSSQKRR